GAQVWDFPKGVKLCDLPYRVGDTVMLTPDGRYVLRQEQEKPPLLVYDARTGQPADAFPRLRDVPSLGTRWPGVSNISADGRRLLAINGGVPTVYDVATGQPVRPLPDVRENWGLLSLDGRRVLGLAAERTALGVWDVDTGRRAATLEFPEP